MPLPQRRPQRSVLLGLASLMWSCALAEKLRFTGWHDKLADRKKKLYENSTQMLTGQTTRSLSMTAILKHHRARVASGATPVTSGTDLYEFGVYTGGGLRMWLRKMAQAGHTFSGKVWGFDSFEGMPSEDPRYKTRLRQKDPGWLAGGLNTAEQLRIADWDTLCRTIVRNIGQVPPERIHMVRGFYNESLAGGRKLARRLRMRPAFLVDFDCDLYTSSVQALRFVLDAGILQPGGYVYMDDIMPWVWRDGKTPSLEQKLAYEELTKEYGLEWDELQIGAQKREMVYVRPVLMLKACRACRPPLGSAGHAAVAEQGATASMCLTPAKEMSF